MSNHIPSTPAPASVRIHHKAIAAISDDPEDRCAVDELLTDTEALRVAMCCAEKIDAGQQ